MERPIGLGKGVGRVGNQCTNRNHPNHCIVKIDENRKKNLGDMRRLAVAQVPVKNYRPMVVRKKTLKQRW